MNKKRNFLVPFAALASAFASEQASATINNHPKDKLSSDSNTTQIKTVSSDVVVQDAKGDMFKFIMQRTDAGQLMAYHSSHSSHSSHQSHSSHTSGR